eukprot:GFUD01120368.1.p1 GENE.GFUD01120368.1~~GFUD01120368.1.p1  ORF type:complete len:119 (-),score=26.48 GFUD01120368.1:771-1127(-)
MLVSYISISVLSINFLHSFFLGLVLGTSPDPAPTYFPDQQYNKNGAAEDDEVLGEVKRHKILLGAFSWVFRDEFFGSLKDTNQVTPVKETTLEAFEKMFDYIYSKDIKWRGTKAEEMR